MDGQQSVFRWLQPFAVTVHDYEGMDPAIVRPVLAVQESPGGYSVGVRMSYVVVNDANELRVVAGDQIKVVEVGSWTALTALSQRNNPAARAAQAGLSLPGMHPPANQRVG